MAATNSVAFDRTPPRGRGDDKDSPRVEPKPQQPDLRLIIEEDDAVGSYVYKTVDRRTGEIVAQIPREEVLKLRERADYEPGELVTTQA